MTIENYISFFLCLSYFSGCIYSFLIFNNFIDLIVGALLIGLVMFLIFSMSSTLISVFKEEEYSNNYRTQEHETILEECKIIINKQQNLLSKVQLENQKKYKNNDNS